MNECKGPAQETERVCEKRPSQILAGQKWTEGLDGLHECLFSKDKERAGKQLYYFLLGCAFSVLTPFAHC